MSVKIQLAQKGIYFTSASKNYIRMICPKCQKLQVKNWDDPEFYFSLTYKRGHCFRCDLKVKTEKEFLTLFNLRPLGFSLNVPTDTKKSIIWPTPIPEDCVPAYQSKKAKTYLGERHLGKQDIERYGILFCRGGWYGDRIIIPVFNHRKAYCTFVSRTITDTLPHDRKKYEFPRASGISHLLFNLNFFRSESVVWLVEGTFDAFHTFPYSVATFGKHISDAQINLLRMKGFRRVVLCWDYDGWHDTPDLWNNAVKRLKKYFFVTEVKLPDQGTDPTAYHLKDLQDMARGMHIA